MNLKTRFQNFALLLYIFSVNFEQWDPFKTGIGFFITKSTVILYLSFCILSARKLFTLSKLGRSAYLLIAFFILGTATSFFNIHNGFDEFFNISLFLNIIVFICIFNHIRIYPKIVNQIFSTYVISSLLLSVLYFSGFETSNYVQGRGTIFNINQNALGINLSIAVILIVHFLWNSNQLNQYKLISVISILILSAFIAQTGSRSAVVSLMSSILILIFFKKHRNISVKFFTTIFAFILFAISIYYFLTHPILGNRIIVSLEEGDLSGRDIYWVEIFKLFKQNPVFGIGKTGLAYETDFLFGTYTTAHNFFIELLVTTGIVGLILFLLFLYPIFKTSLLNFKRGYLLPLALMMPVIVMILVGHPIGSKLTWLIFAFIFYIKTNKKHALANSYAG